MIIAKCSHDTDYIAWLLDSKCTSVSSYGRLSYFNPQHAPEGAADRCTANCPHASPQGGNCMYDAHRYIGEKASWLRMIYPHPTERTDEAVVKWLETSPWGRCAWKCDNDAVDHQVVSMEFENGATASLTMTAFDCGRGLEVYGTKASLRGGDIYENFGNADLMIRDHATGNTELISLKSKEEEESEHSYQGHGGGDYGLVNAMDSIFRGEGTHDTLIEHAIEGHLIGFAAEESRLANGTPVTLNNSQRGIS